VWFYRRADAGRRRLAIMVSEKYDLVTTILDGASMSIKNRAVLNNQL
jgi:hypothetical protein